MRVDDALRGVVRLGLDTAPLIYLIEADPRYGVVMIEVARRISEGWVRGVTSVVTLAEVLVQPFAHEDVRLQQRYRDILLNSGGLLVCSIDAVVAERAAELRAQYGVRLPDALQVAVALEQGCEAFLTNDRRLARISDLQVLLLDDLELE